MTNIAYTAYLSELINLRNMIKNQMIEINDLKIKIIELENKTPAGLKVIDIWSEGENNHSDPYSADVVYQKLTDAINRIEALENESSGKIDSLIQKVDTLTEINNAQNDVLSDHTKKLNSLSSNTNDLLIMTENSIIPSLARIEEKIDTTNKYCKSIILNIADVKALSSSINTTVTNTYKVAEANFSKLSTIATTEDTINKTVQEILTIIKTRLQ